MYISTHSSQPLARRAGLARFEWWPAVLIGLLALVSGTPDSSSAQTLLTLL